LYLQTSRSIVNLPLQEATFGRVWRQTLAQQRKEAGGGLYPENQGATEATRQLLLLLLLLQVGVEESDSRVPEAPLPPSKLASSVLVALLHPCHHRK